jgi:hypothetical protein
MKLPDDTRIADQKTVADWTSMRGGLTASPDPAAWTEAFRDFFKARLGTRYFQPIQTLESMGQNTGEGFAIVALHCSLIEFLASTLEGKTYKYRKSGDPPLGPFEYSNSSDMFVKFLEDNDPFRGMFSSTGTARDFYSSVRCGLLHEARTKGRWRIRVGKSATQAIDAGNKVIYRNLMRSAFDEFVNRYGQELSTDVGLQQAFIRKFDSLCEE